jgi:hypothetical protein
MDRRGTTLHGSDRVLDLRLIEDQRGDVAVFGCTSQLQEAILDEQ